MKVDKFVADRVGVDGAPISAFVLPPHVTDLQRPVFNHGPDYTEPRVVNDTPLLISQRKRIEIEPGDLW